MLKISVSLETYRAIAGSLPTGSRAFPAGPEGINLWLDRVAHKDWIRSRVSGDATPANGGQASLTPVRPSGAPPALTFG